MKNIKLVLGGFVLSIISLLFPSNDVFAREVIVENESKYILIDSVSELREEFKDKNAVIDGKTVTLTGDVVFENEDYVEGSDDALYEDIYFTGEDYILNLNGYNITTSNIYISDSSMTINDEMGNGKVNAVVWVSPSQESNKIPKLIINNGNFYTILNEDGILEINDGNFGSVVLEGKTTINGGEFTSYIQYDTETDETGAPFQFHVVSAINLYKDITINSAEFKTKDLDYAVYIYKYDGDKKLTIDKTDIENVVEESYEIEYEYCDDCEFNSEYEANYTSLKVVHPVFDKIIKNGVLTLDVEKPDNDEKAYFFLSEVVRNMAKSDKYYIEIAFPSEGDFDPEKGVISLYKTSGEYITDRRVKVVYKESDKSASAKVAPIVKKMAEKTKGKSNIENSFILDDLYLINYLNSLKGGIKSEMSLNFSKELIELTNGSNIAYKFDTRMGSDSAGLWFYLGGWGFVYYDGNPIDGTPIGITRSHVLYVPSDTKDTDEARIEAALKRIKDYLGITDEIKIEVGGTLESTGNEKNDWNEYGLIDEKTSGKNYYNITINGKTYMFAICKKDAKELENPKYVASDLMSNISIKSDSSKLPLDTAISVKEVTSKEIEKVLGTSEYYAYDISLFSNTKETNITKLEEDKFIVSIPMPKDFEDKDVTVIYINDEGKKEEHIPLLSDDKRYVTFETNHFSTYILVEKDFEENPNTLDSIEKTAVTGIISLIGILVIAFYLNKIRA